MSKAKKLNLEKLLAAWMSDKTRSQIQLEFGIGADTLRAIVANNNWPAKPQSSKKKRVAIGRLYAAWMSPMTRKQISVKFGISESMLSTLARDYDWPEKEKASGRKRDPDYLPSEEEINRVTAEIRRGWDEKETARRTLGPKRIDWSAREYTYDHKNTMFNGLN